MSAQKRIFLTLVALFAIIQASKAQTSRTDTLLSRYDVYSSYLAQEKVYLHIDRTAFCGGETVWFKGYVANASDRDGRASSNYIYVELFRPDQTMERRFKIKRRADGFPGHIFLRDDMEPGRYTIRAYTLSQLDFPQEQMFHQSITIFGGKQKVTKDSPAAEISFYPEGGRYFVGANARIGFKASDASGRSIQIDGSIVDQDGNEVSRASTRHDGMGDFRFIPEPGKTYSFLTSDGKRVPLPSPATEGAAIRTTSLSGRTFVTVSGASEGKYALLLRDISELRHVADIDVSASPSTLILADDQLASGINQLILIDSKGSIVSERLFFKYAPSPSASISTQGIPGARKLVSADVELASPEGKPVNGSASVSVTRGSLSSCAQDDGIDSYMWLSSELRASINDPRHYFDPSLPLRERAADMDLLMMIQGWTYYDMKSICTPSASLGEGMTHKREYWQSVSGKISRALSNKIPQNFTMTVLMPSVGHSTIMQVEEGRNFVIDSLDFEEGTGMIIKVSRIGKGFDYTPEWNGDEFAKGFKYKPAPGLAFERREEVVVEYSDPSDTLKAAVITSTRPEYALGINARELPRSDYKEFGHMTLVDYIQMKTSFTFDGQFMRSRRTTLLQSRPDNWDESPVKLLVDGMEAPWDAFGTLTMDEIESISVSNNPDMVIRALEGVVSIKLEYGTRVTRLSDTEPSLLFFTPLGWQTPADFYSPRYDGWDSTEPDHRNTIFWSPAIRIRDGRAHISFYSADDEDYPYMIHIEGMSDEGVPISITHAIEKQ